MSSDSIQSQSDPVTPAANDRKQILSFIADEIVSKSENKTSVSSWLESASSIIYLLRQRNAVFEKNLKEIDDLCASDWIKTESDAMAALKTIREMVVHAFSSENNVVIYGPEKVPLQHDSNIKFRIVTEEDGTPTLQILNSDSKWEDSSNACVAATIITNLLAKHAAEKPEKVDIVFGDRDPHRGTFSITLGFSELLSSSARKYSPDWIAKALVESEAKVKKLEEELTRMKEVENSKHWTKVPIVPERHIDYDYNQH